MKKKIFLFLAVMLLFSLVACGGERSDNPNGHIEVLKKIVVNDFENSADMGKLIIGNKLGKVQFKGESTFVKSGEKSAKLSITGSTDWGTPYMYQTFNIDEEEYSDFSKYTKMTLWVYNDDDISHEVQMEYSFSKGSLGKMNVGLASKEWTMITYDITRNYLPIDNSGNYYPCNGVYFYFDLSENGDPYHLYFDELSLYRTNKGFNKNEMYLDEHEICSFDHDYQQGMITSSGDYLHVEPSLEISHDYAQKEKDLNLKVIAPAGDTPWSAGGGWPGIEINRTIIGMFDFSLYDDSDEFCFDVYSPEGNGLQKVWLTFVNTLNNSFYRGTEVALSPGQWKTIRVSVGELNAKVTQPELYGFIATKRIIVRWGEFTDMDRVVYFNNFRMELNNK